MTEAIDLARDPVDVARDLIGCVLVHDKGGRVTAGRIVETEAYGGKGQDACSHCFRGPTPRNEVMFGPPSRLYVYFTYGMHYCTNIVAHEPGALGGAVLLRALEPVEGIDLMAKRRGLMKETLLCAGPARLAVAMGFGRADNGRRIGTKRLRIEARSGPASEIAVGTRIGVNCADAGRRWRFGEAGSAWLSKPFR